MLEILSVDPESIALELELEAGDRILSINGQAIDDLLDFEVACRLEDLSVEVLKKDGERWQVDFEKDAEEPLGLEFPHPEPDQCGNNCIFCFVHQLPKGLRKTLYIKDEDFRFSYLYGAYVTLTNIGEGELGRIIEQQLSPLYVSVHATDKDLRRSMLGRNGPPILDLLRRLTSAGIEIHTQIVVCPGINDDEALVQTIEDLYTLAPGVRSLAVVPVGLTGFRQDLPFLRPSTANEARALLDLLHEYQIRFIEQSGSRFVFAADEFYLKAQIEFPELDSYEDLSQLENGVGMIPLFRAEVAQVLDEVETETLTAMTVSTITGQSAVSEVQSFIDALDEKTGVRILLHVVRNDFFGGHVSVTGLIAGADIVKQLRDRPLGDVLMIPDVTLKDGTDLFLDDLSLRDLERELKVRVVKIGSSPWGLLEGLEALS
jgi:putative radical SAM enzyme (TIGR03279 family)